MGKRVIKIEKDDHLLRIMKTWDGKTIHVFRHDFDQELTDLLGRREYESRGRMVAEYDSRGRYRYTLNEVRDHHS